jgi:hypothetical protein
MLKDLSSQQLASLLQAVETRLVNRLSTSGRLYKSEVMQAIAEAGHCSYNSAGIEKSLLKVIKSKQIPLTPKFAELMNEMGPLTTPTTPPVPFQDPKQAQSSQASLVNLKSVSLLEWTPSGTRVSFTDGGIGQAGRIDVSTLRSSCSLIEFRGSSS